MFRLPELLRHHETSLLIGAGQVVITEARRTEARVYRDCDPALIGLGTEADDLHCTRADSRHSLRPGASRQCIDSTLISIKLDLAALPAGHHNREIAPTSGYLLVEARSPLPG